MDELPELTPDDLVSVVERPAPSTGCPRCSPDTPESLRLWTEFIELEP